MPDPQAPPHIQRCAFQQPYRGGAWQCRLTDPHEGIDHDLPPDAEFGRDLDTADPLWLAAKLRDQVAKTRHAQRQADEAAARLTRVDALHTADEYGGCSGCREDCFYCQSEHEIGDCPTRKVLREEAGRG